MATLPFLVDSAEEVVGDDSPEDDLERRRSHWKMYIQRTGGTDINAQVLADIMAVNEWPATDVPFLPLLKPAQEAVASIGSQYLGTPIHQTRNGSPPLQQPDQSIIPPSEFSFPTLNLAPEGSRFFQKNPPSLDAPPAPTPPKKASGFFARQQQRPAAVQVAPPPDKQTRLSAFSRLLAQKSVPAVDREQLRSVVVPSPLVQIKPEPIFEPAPLPVPVVQLNPVQPVMPAVVVKGERSSDFSMSCDVSASSSDRDTPRSDPDSTSSGFGSSGFNSLLEDEVGTDAAYEQRWQRRLGDFSSSDFRPSSSALSAAAHSMRDHRTRSRSPSPAETYTRWQYEEDQRLRAAEDKKRRAEQESQDLEDKIAGLRKAHQMEMLRLEQMRRQKPQIIPPPPRPRSEQIAAVTLFPDVLASARKGLVHKLLPHPSNCKCPCSSKRVEAVRPKATGALFLADRSGSSLRPSRIVELTQAEAHRKQQEEAELRKKSDARLPPKLRGEKRKADEVSDGYQSEEY